MAIDKQFQSMIDAINIQKLLGQAQEKGPLGLPKLGEPPKDPLEQMGIKGMSPPPPPNPFQK